MRTEIVRRSRRDEQGIALVIALLKALIGFVGFVALAIKIIIVLAFIALFLGVAFMIFRGWQNSRKRD